MNHNQHNQNPHGFPPAPPPPPAHYFRDGRQPGQDKAVGSLVLGICAMVTGLGIILGIIGIVMAVQARKDGYVGGLATAGLVLSIISLALTALAIACICAFVLSIPHQTIFW